MVTRSHCHWQAFINLGCKTKLAGASTTSADSQALPSCYYLWQVCGFVALVLSESMPVEHVLTFGTQIFENQVRVWRPGKDRALLI